MRNIVDNIRESNPTTLRLFSTCGHAKHSWTQREFDNVDSDNDSQVKMRHCKMYVAAGTFGICLSQVILYIQEMQAAI
jgi:hypothetical protein